MNITKVLPDLRNTYKLFTKEDTFNIHKIIGFSCLIHYIIRFSNALIYKNMLFDSSPLSLLCILLHIALSVSSLIFHIPNKRNKAKPMIWPEFRLHSIIFGLRSLFIMLICWFYEATNLHFFLYSKGLVVIFTLIFADMVTSYYKKLALVEEKDTTMRGMPIDASEGFKKKLDLFYSASQIFATMNMIFLTNDQLSPFDTAFLVLWPIQISAFMMTLVRKSIISSDAWHFWYAISLLMNYIYPSLVSSQAQNANIYWLLSLAIIVFRFKFSFNKYLLWSVTVLVNWFLLYNGLLFASISTIKDFLLATYF